MWGFAAFSLFWENSQKIKNENNGLPRVISIISKPIPPAWLFLSFFQELNFPSSGQPLKLLCTAASLSNQTSGHLVYYWLNWWPRAEYHTQVTIRATQIRACQKCVFISSFLCAVFILTLEAVVFWFFWFLIILNMLLMFSSFCLGIILTCYSSSSIAFNSIFLHM